MRLLCAKDHRITACTKVPSPLVGEGQDEGEPRLRRTQYERLVTVLVVQDGDRRQHMVGGARFEGEPDPVITFEVVNR